MGRWYCVVVMKRLMRHPMDGKSKERGVVRGRFGEGNDYL